MIRWDLGLSLGPEGVGTAVRVETAHLIGVFPTAARAVSAASGAAPGGAPEHIILVYPQSMSSDELGEQLGECAIAGVKAPVATRDTEVLAAMAGRRALLIDSDAGLLASSAGPVVDFSPEVLADWFAEDPFGHSVYLTGEPASRDSYVVAARDFPPTLVERPALAALALTLMPVELSTKRRRWWSLR
ncbi:hypothetical protein [Corynebacterium doosanense]|uniref:Uncharacterized protein n=1 Tax=Corynebacterium doosanense CAU 212 = DSM 45436 TaxID=558173 RepID=A0A097IJA5_9CORY|nr:hypothetical protein [Corynebacterium doosanense]AIT62232.1 hypothetical protein CDOO_03920 [Corynebacterium doosanense CAU 212 = DSM 45436]